MYDFVWVCMWIIFFSENNHLTCFSPTPPHPSSHHTHTHIHTSLSTFRERDARFAQSYQLSRIGAKGFRQNGTNVRVEVGVGGTEESNQVEDLIGQSWVANRLGQIRWNGEGILLEGRAVSWKLVGVWNSTSSILYFLPQPPSNSVLFSNIIITPPLSILCISNPFARIFLRNLCVNSSLSSASCTICHHICFRSWSLQRDTWQFSPPFSFPVDT